MCDYSVEADTQRGAEVGDELITKVFGHHVGFASMKDRRVAVCLRPGTELSFDQEVKEVQGRFFLAPPICTHDTKVARFKQVDLDDPHTMHDKLEFPNGESCFVGFLAPGQRATVIQLPVAVKAEAETQKQELSIPEPTETANEGSNPMRRAFERIFG
jgi:hypothetical protein